MPKIKKSSQLNTSLSDHRPPVVTIMGHVDHGKTSLLDAIREKYSVGALLSTSVSKGTKEKITQKESGGITQHTGAYNVEKDGKRIVFIDTPGHEAFAKMRARGGTAADIVILVVAADDGVMPQTIEAISHAKAANVPIIVAINKCDLAGANIDKVKRQLSQHGIMVEGYGGDIVTVQTSATKYTGIDELLDVISLVADMNVDKLKANMDQDLEAIVIESRRDTRRGIVASVIIKNGSLSIRDDVVSAGGSCRVKSIIDSLHNSINKAVVGDAVEILGFTEPPNVGDVITKAGFSPKVEQVSATEIQTGDAASIKAEKDKKKLNIIIKADTLGTLEAIKSSAEKISFEESKVNVVSAMIGEVKESDVLMAYASKAVIFAFRVGVSTSIKEQAVSMKVLVREHDIIYKLLEEIEQGLEGALEIEEAKIKGRGLIIAKFTLPKSGDVISGTLIEAGKFKVGNRVGIFRENKEIPLYVARIKSIHIKDKEVDSGSKGDECGLLFKPALSDTQVEDVVEVL